MDEYVYELRRPALNADTVSDYVDTRNTDALYSVIKTVLDFYGPALAVTPTQVLAAHLATEIKGVDYDIRHGHGKLNDERNRIEELGSATVNGLRSRLGETITHEDANAVKYSLDLFSDFVRQIFGWAWVFPVDIHHGGHNSPVEIFPDMHLHLDKHDH